MFLYRFRLHLLIVAMFGVACSAHSQVLIGGSVSVNSKTMAQYVDGVKYAGTKIGEPDILNISVIPHVGFCVGNDYQVGLRIGLEYRSEKTKMAVTSNPAELDRVMNVYAYNAVGGIYGRRNLFSVGPFGAFLELDIDASLGYASTSTEYVAQSKPSTHTDTYVTGQLSANIVPGLSCALNQRWTIDLWLNSLSAGYDLDVLVYKEGPDRKQVMRIKHLGHLTDGLDHISLKGLLETVTVGATCRF